jgi:hypothetical protein
MKKFNFHYSKEFPLKSRLPASGRNCLQIIIIIFFFERQGKASDKQKRIWSGELYGLLLIKSTNNYWASILCQEGSPYLKKANRSPPKSNFPKTQVRFSKT